MRVVKSTRSGIPATSPATQSTLAQWLGSVGLDDLLGAIVYADQREPWAFDSDSDPLACTLQTLHNTLSSAAPLSGGSLILPEDTAADLIYLLAFLRTSQCLRLLFRFNVCLPGLAEQFLTRAMQSDPPPSREALLLSRRLLYLMRHSIAAQIFSRARHAEVLAAITAARL